MTRAKGKIFRVEKYSSKISDLPLQIYRVIVLVSDIQKELQTNAIVSKGAQHTTIADTHVSPLFG